MGYTVYVAGPMRGLPDFNFPMFDAVQAVLEGKEIDWNVISPAAHDREVARSKGVKDITTVPGYHTGDLVLYEEALGAVYDLLAWDVGKIATECDGIVMLPGWEKSTGSRIERFVAESLGRTVWLAGLSLNNGWYVEYDPATRMQVEVVDWVRA